MTDTGLQAALRRYMEARLDRSVSEATVIMYADELAEAVMRAGEQA